MKVIAILIKILEPIQIDLDLFSTSKWPVGKKAFLFFSLRMHRKKVNLHFWETFFYASKTCFYQWDWSCFSQHKSCFFTWGCFMTLHTRLVFVVNLLAENVKLVQNKVFHVCNLWNLLYYMSGKHTDHWISFGNLKIRTYRKVSSSRLVYYSILKSLDQRSQYISIKLFLS